MRRVHGHLLLGVCAALLVATKAPAESYRLVEPTLVQSEIRHGHPQRIEHPRSRKSLFGIWFVGGASELGLEELNDELVRHGWSRTASTEDTFGFALTGALGRLYAALVLDGEHDEVFRTTGESANVGVLRVAWQFGWHAYDGEALSLMPFAALGGSQTNVVAKTSDPDAFPLFSAEIRARTAGYELRRLTGLLEIGIGAQTLVPAFGSDTRNGPALGVQLGYRTGFAEGDWRVGDSDLDIGAPSTMQTGLFVRLLIGWAWSNEPKRAERQRVDRCSGPNCYVRCDPGFVDSDLDPRNGCEPRPKDWPVIVE